MRDRRARVGQPLGQPLGLWRRVARHWRWVGDDFRAIRDAALILPALGLLLLGLLGVLGVGARIVGGLAALAH